MVAVRVAAVKPVATGWPTVTTGADDDVLPGGGGRRPM
jgi:hypothetical protein